MKFSIFTNGKLRKTMDNNILLAKSDRHGDSQTLFDHTNNVIDTVKKVCENLPQSLSNMPQLLESAKIASLFHDVGKAHNEFQKLLKSERNEWMRRRHEVLSAIFFAIYVSDDSLPLNNYDVSHCSVNWKLGIWLAIILHHKSLYREFKTNTRNFLDYARDISKIPFIKKDELFMYRNLRSVFANNSEIIPMIHTLIKKHNIKCPTKECVEYLDLENITLKNFFSSILDRENSKELINLLIAEEQSNLLNKNERLIFALLLGILKTSDHMASMGITPISIPLLNSYEIDEKLYPYQKKLSQTCNSVILRAPTASGKTIGAYVWAANNQMKNARLFYILPYQASINAMFKVLNNLTKTKDQGITVGIKHAKNFEFLSAYFSDSDDDDYLRRSISPRDLKSLSNEIYYPIKVSTAHQLLRLLLFGKGWERIMLELYDSLIVFDEIHAYEPKILGLIVRLMKILRKFNVKMIIMTATLPEFIIEIIKSNVFEEGDVTEIELSQTEMGDKKILEKKRHSFSLCYNSVLNEIKTSEFKEMIVSRYESNEKQLFVCNTVIAAQELYCALKQCKEIDPNYILLYHGRFSYKDRQEKERKVHGEVSNDSEEIKILIATQVVEVSLNIDYMYGYLELCPIDALIQRMGRVNRYGNQKIEKSEIDNIIIFAKKRYDSFIYDSSIVSNSLDVLKRNESLPLTEQELKNMVEEVYPTYTDEGWKEFYSGLNHSIGSNFEEKLEVGLQQEWLLELIENSDSKLEILPRELESEYYELWSQKKFAEANSLLVSANYRKEWKDYLEDMNKRHYIKLLTHPSYKYDEELGLRRVVRKHETTDD